MSDHNHTSGTDMADTSPDSPLQPSNPPQALMHILEAVYARGFNDNPNAEGNVSITANLLMDYEMKPTEALAALQAYISNVIGPDEDPDRIHVSHFVHEASCKPQLDMWIRDDERAEQRKRAGL